MRKINSKLVTTMASVFALSTSCYSVAQTSFDIQGLSVGMGVEEFIETAKPLSANGDVNETMVVMVTPQGKQIEETAHRDKVSFAGADNSNYNALLTRLPLEERIFKITRQIQYGTTRDDPSNFSPLTLFENSLIEKYGEPVHIRNRKQSSYQRTTYIFTESPLTEDCLAETLARANLNYTDAKLCPSVLEVELMFLNQPNHPVINASFIMTDYALTNLHYETYSPYWDDWMQNYLTSQETGGRPEL